MPIFDSLQTIERRRRRMRRRTFISVALAGVGGYLGYRWWRRRPQILAQRATRYLTPNRDFYRVAISGSPAVNPSTWRLRIRSGDQFRDYSLEQLRGEESLQVHKTLSCISNPVGGTAVGNALWTVTRLAPLLAPFAPQPGQSVRFRGLDGFDSSVPVAVALRADSYLAYEMNGVPLPREHGFPLRVLLAGKYGMKQPRWLEEIELAEGGSSGYWERRGWSNRADLNPASRIDSARPTSQGDWKAEGVAYCGAAAVGRVECKLDDGPWREASLSSPAEPDSWATWQWRFRPPPGRRILAVRVTDASGQTQENGFSGTFPSGATGIHRVILDVSKEV